jgi:ABC-2 type transport system permease protein
VTAETPAIEMPAPRMPLQRAEAAIRSAFYIGQREIRNVLRSPADFLPGVFIPVFFFFIQVGSLSQLAQGSGSVENYKAFQLPVAMLFASSNGGAGLNMVIDIESGYFEKLLVTPVSRLALLAGAMGADFARIVAQCTIVIAIALATGTEFATGIAGAALLVVVASLWGLVYSAIGFAIALKTGSPAATQSAWVIFFPLIFLTTSFAPKEKLSGWLSRAADFNPVTYLLRGMRALSQGGWDAGELGVALLAIGVLGALTITSAFRALMSRVR